MVTKAVIDTLIAEAGGEGEEGIIAAAWAIQQRAAARNQTIDQVVRSGFDGFTNPGSAAVKAQQNPALRARVEQIMTGVQSGSIPNPVPGADHFLSGNVSPSWSKGMRLVATIGGHRFYASGRVPETAQGNSVGTRLDVAAPKIAPRVATASPQLAARRNKQNFAPAADMSVQERNAVTPFLTRDGQGVTDVAGAVLGKDMKTRLPQSVGNTYAGQERAGGKTVTAKVSASDKTRAAAVAPRSPALVTSNVQTAKAEQASARGPGRPVVSPSRTAITAATKKQAADVAVIRSANQQNADAERNRKVVASIPTAPARLPPIAPPGVGKPPATRVMQSVPVKPAAPASANVASAKAEQAAARGVGAPERPPVSPPSSGKANTNVASAKAEQSAARGPAVKKRETAVEAITKLAETPGPNAAPKTADRLPSQALAFTGGALQPPTKQQVEAGTGFRLGTPVAGAAPAPVVQSAAMIAARQAKKVVAPAPVVRAAAPIVAPRKPVPVAPAVAAAAAAARAAQSKPSAPASLWQSNPIAFGAWATSHSGDTSVGSQVDAAAARASGEGGRTRRY